MKPNRTLRRRSFLAMVAGTGAIALGLTTRPYAASGQTAGRQPPRRPSPITDGDKNPADVTGPRGCTDYDSGARADPPSGGRGTGLNDADRESGRPRARQYGDPDNCGRRPASR